MKSVNHCIFMGYVGGDAEVRQTRGEQTFATFSVAVSRTWQAEGKKQEATEWIRCIGWDSKTRKLATLLGQYVKKGMPVYVEGRLQSNTWDHASGVKMTSWQLVLRDVVFLPDGKQHERAAAPTMTSAPPQDFEDFPGALEDDDDGPF